MSFAPKGRPECQRCGKVGEKEWHVMTNQEKKSWEIFRASAKYTLLCKPCSRVHEDDDERFEKEREYYSKAKEMLYPKQEHKVRLKRLKSAEVWEGTESFYESYRPPSTIAQLSDQQEYQDSSSGLVRKGTGVPVMEHQKQAERSDGSGCIMEETSIELMGDGEGTDDEDDDDNASGGSPVDTVLHGNFKDIVMVQEDTLTDEDDFEAACERAARDGQ